MVCFTCSVMILSLDNEIASKRIDLSTESCIRITISRNDPFRLFRVRFQLRGCFCRIYLVNSPVQTHDALDLNCQALIRADRTIFIRGLFCKSSETRIIRLWSKYSTGRQISLIWFADSAINGLLYSICHNPRCDNE